MNRSYILSCLAFCGLFTAALLADGIMGTVSPIEPAEKETAEVIAETPAPVHILEETQEPENDYSWIPLADDLAKQLVESCEEYEVPLELALAVIEQESGFNTDAVGPDGKDFGLFQIRESNHAWLQEETGADPMTPKGNIICGVWFLHYLYDYCEYSWEYALTCWRWGPGNGQTCVYSEKVVKSVVKWKSIN